MLINMYTIIVGASTGVGYEYLKRLVQKNKKVLVLDVNTGLIEDKLKLDDIDFISKNLHLIEIDLMDDLNLERLKSDLFFFGDKIESIVFYAGVTHYSSLLECSPKTYKELMQVNLNSVFFLLQLFLKSRDVSCSTSIILTGSLHQFSGDYDRAGYALSKAGLTTLNEHISKHYASFNVRSNLVIMGWTLTEGELRLRGLSTVESVNTFYSIVSQEIPLGRMTTVDDIANCWEFLNSESACMITGSTIKVTGGQLI